MERKDFNEYYRQEFFYSLKKTLDDRPADQMDSIRHEIQDSSRRICENNQAPELTSVFCDWDSLWIDELEDGRYGMDFGRNETIGSEGEVCRFCFSGRLKGGQKT